MCLEAKERPGHSGQAGVCMKRASRLLTGRRESVAVLVLWAWYWCWRLACLVRNFCLQARHWNVMLNGLWHRMLTTGNM